MHRQLKSLNDLNMIRFPEITDTQYMLLRAEVNTGHVLDEKFNLAVNDYQKVIDVFDDLDSAISAGKKIRDCRADVEVMIYDSKRNPIHWLPYDSF